MIRELHIKNYVLIEEAHLEFNENLTLITGETGAGKSIIMGAINYCLGKKTSKNVLKDPEQKAIFELVIENPSELLVITREIFPSGRSLARINGEITSIEELENTVENQIDIYAQQEHNMLLKVQNQLKLIDTFGAKEIEPQKNELAKIVKKINEIEKEIKELESSEQDLESFERIVEDISKSGLDHNDDQLEQQIIKIENAQLINRMIEDVNHSMEQAHSNINQCTKNFEQLEEYLETANEPLKRLESIRIELEDLQSTLYQFEVEDFDELEYETIRTKYDALMYLQKKYQRDLKGLLQLKDESLLNIEKYASRDENLKELKEQFQVEKVNYFKQSNRLKEVREKAFNELRKKILDIFQRVGMQRADLKLSISEIKERVREQGSFSFEILASMNGLHFHPLKEVASGGELSRLMLAIKTAFSEKDEIQTLILDEIDSGISGVTAFEVGSIIRELSKDKQVLVVSHIPQIVAFNDHHLYVEKSDKDVNITKLNQQENVNRLAQMMSSQLSEKSIESARELIEKAKGIG